MKKKIFAAICVFALAIIAFTATVFAERKTEFPVDLIHRSYSSDYVTRINSFEITDVENIPGKYLNRISYELDYTELSGSGSIYMSLRCYDEAGYPIKDLHINPYMEYIDVPDTTAMIEIMPENPTENSQTYFYCKYVNVYAPDGRILAVTDLQVPVYKLVGWSEAVTMMARDENGTFSRSIKISPYDVAAYEAVGWYTIEGTLFELIKGDYYEFKAAWDYNSMIEKTDLGINYLAGTKYEQMLYTMRTEAMDLWRNSCGAPLGVIEYEISENSIGTPEVTIAFRNVSYKKIIAYEMTFTCYNVFGKVEKSYYDYFYDDEADMAPAQVGGGTWTLYGADSVYTVENIRITEVVFEDGTKWYGK